MNGQHRPLGFSVRLFLPGGDPDGLKLVEKSNWTGCGLVFPRTLFPEARKRDELHRAGIYVLVGPDERFDLQRIYVGEGDSIGPRLDQHVKNKDFWTRAIAFVSKDQNLNKANVQYLESRLLALAKAARRCTLDNANTPVPPSLSEADRAETEGFLADVLLCLPVLGYHFFEAPPSPEPTALEFVLQAKGIVARGYETATGFVVRQGSKAVKEQVPSIHAHLSELRTALVKRGVLVDRGPHYEMTEDYVFSSPSTASGAMLGRSSNGRREWKTQDGRTLKAVQSAGVKG